MFGHCWLSVVKSGCAQSLLLATALLVFVCEGSTWAQQVACAGHTGPPSPILVDKKVGPFTVSLWSHPDLDMGTFFVVVTPSAGATIPDDLQVHIAVQPESGRIPEKVYDTWRDPVRDHIQFDNNRVAFDKQEFWRVRLILASSGGGGELLARVEPTPAGSGKWDLLFYVLPFALLLLLWMRALSSRRTRAAPGLQQV